MQKLSVLVIAIACAAMTSADARVGQASQSYGLGYTEIYCDCSGGCPAFCLSPNASRVMTPLSATAGPVDSSAAWSPDGAKVAYLSAGDIIVMDAAGTNAVNVTLSASTEGGPAWSPDGARIAFAGDPTGAPELYLMNPDGSNVVRVTTQLGVAGSRPTWSPDSKRLAFGCEVVSGNRDICVIDVNGSGLVRLTADAAIDDGAAWSPDGATIAFSTTRYGAYSELATMRGDGSNVTRLGGGIIGSEPAWSPDGGYLAFTSWGSESFGVYIMTAAGDDITLTRDFAVEPAWMPGASVLGARMSVRCERLTCTFDATGSLGPATAYSWTFGDGGTGSGVTVTHTYAEGGSYDVALTLSGEDGATATARDSLSLNRPPVASFTVACEGLSCIFDWSASHDPEGGQLGVNWSFGDGGHSWYPVEGRPSAGRHLYQAPGTYTATMRVADAFSEAATSSQTITVTRGAMHVGDIDAATVTQQNTWSATATITMHDEGHRPLVDTLVSASWDGGSSVSCTTGAAGSCVLTRSKIPRKASVNLTVLGASNSNFFYAPAGNHDPDGGSTGTTISISRQ
jgi:dipeptidyl aminopeptidase/acylaminoacyl peptidase